MKEAKKKLASEPTAGPWEVERANIKQHPFYVRGGDDVVADIMQRPEAEANARLIAAAPDLLSALEDLIGERSAEDFNIAYPGFYPPDVDRAIAAIKKARGEK